MRNCRKLITVLVLTVVTAAIAFAGCAGGNDNTKKSGSEKPAVDPGIIYEEPETLVNADPEKHMRITLLDDGTDIFQPVNGYSYRYGPTMLTYKDGTMDAWFATPGTHGEWDWITYRRYDSVTGTWTKEVAAVQPTGESWDRLSCCDPGAVYFGGYYYIGYTSTVDIGGVRNNVYVARSRIPDGPYEKWNGSGWGGDPYPVIYYDGKADEFGAGEPAMTVVGDTIYFYYTWKSAYSSGAKINQLRVSTGNANDENWPATLTYRGVCFDCASPTGQDSSDVKYVEDYGKFLAVCTDERFTDKSALVFYESDDGLAFTRIAELHTGLACKLHNSGMSSRQNGHINTADTVYVAYAYGSDWGVWATRMHRISITLADEPDFSDKNGKNTEYKVELAEVPDTLWTVGITTLPHAYRQLVGDEFVLSVYVMDTAFAGPKAVTDAKAIKFTGYDRSVISVSGTSAKALRAGETFVTAEYDGRSTTFPVRVYERGTDLIAGAGNILSLKATETEYVIDIGSREALQIRVTAAYADGTWNEIFKAEEGVAYSGYDTDIIRVSKDGAISSRKQKGETWVTVTAGNAEVKVKVICR